MPAKERAAELIELCKLGKLYAVARWIESGKSIQVPEDFKQKPLDIAVFRGFHSLVELLVRHELDSRAKNDSLALAVSLKRVDLVEVLVEHGADIHAVPFVDVLNYWTPAVIGFFIEHGADVVTDSPFAHAFAERVRTALRFYLQVKESRPDLAEDLQRQADDALRYHCSEGNVKWTGLMAWVGANPRVRGPVLYRSWNDEESYTTALREICQEGSLAGLKLLKPDPARDDLTELLRCATFRVAPDLLRYLLELGADSNDKENGGSTALDGILWHLWHVTRCCHNCGELASLYDVRDVLQCITVLVEYGAVWNPSERHQMNDVRQCLYRSWPEVTLELLRILVGNDACAKETLQKLLKTKKMKDVLKNYRRELAPLGLRMGGRPPPERPKTIRELIPYATMCRYERETLYEEVWARPLREVAADHGVSDVALGKRCRRLFIPLPGRGYWAKKRASMRVPPRPPLPALDCIVK